LLLTKENWAEYRAKGCKYICYKNYLKEYHVKHRGAHLAYNKIYSKQYSQKLKAIVLNAYGAKCNCCGAGLYSYVIEQNFPKDKYQILCYNCNCAKGTSGICPHKKVNKEIAQHETPSTVEVEQFIHTNTSCA
jgi:hypothetical protein